MEEQHDYSPILDTSRTRNVHVIDRSAPSRRYQRDAQQKTLKRKESIGCLIHLGYAGLTGCNLDTSHVYRLSYCKAEGLTFWLIAEV
jgi:hypothetical protein